jgi:hypothetical protein
VLLAFDILTVIEVSFVEPVVKKAGGSTYGSLVGYLVIAIFFSKARLGGLVEVWKGTHGPNR